MDILTRLDACAECEQAPLAPLLADAAAEIRKLRKGAMPHGSECLTDKASMTVCEGMYADKCDDVNGLCEALRAVLALAGEDPNVRKIVEDAIAEHGA